MSLNGQNRETKTNNNAEKSNNTTIPAGGHPADQTVKNGTKTPQNQISSKGGDTMNLIKLHKTQGSSNAPSKFSALTTKTQDQGEGKRGIKTPKTIPTNTSSLTNGSQDKNTNKVTNPKNLKPQTKKQKSLKKEEKKEPCCLSWVFFFEFNHLFAIGAKRGLTKQDMAPLPPGIRSDVVNEEAEGILKKGVDKNNSNEVFMKLANMDMNIATGLLSGKKKKKEGEEGENGKKKINDITELIWIMIQDKIKMAILFKVLENVIIVSLTVMLRIYNPAVKGYSSEYGDTPIAERLRKYDTLILFVFPLIALVLSILRYSFKEHSAKFVCQSGSKTGQTLRTLLFQKLRSSNLSFLKNADSSIIAKMILFDFNIILGYVGKLPDLISFPVILVLSISAMIYFVGWTALGSLVVFLIGWLMLILVTKKLVYQNMKYQYYGSQRATIFIEFLENLKPAKQDKAESLFQKRINFLRKREEHYLDKVHLYRAIASFFMKLTPLFSILFILWLEVINGNELDIATTFTVVSIVNSMNKPLRRFVDILDRHYEYNHAKESLNRLLFLIPDKPNQAVYDKTLKTGEVVIKDCDVEMDDDNVVKTALSRIFGDEIDIDQELMKFTQEVKKEKQEAASKKSSVSGKAGALEVTSKDNEELISFNDRVNISENGSKGKNSTSLAQKIKESEKEHKPMPKMTRKSVISNLSLHIKPHSKLFFINAPTASKIMEERGITGEIDETMKLEKSHPHHIIHSLLGENYLPNLNSLRYKGKVVYQNSKNPLFLPRQSLQDNILFGEIMIKSRYKLILETVDLNIDNYPGRDMFEVTEKGQNLSATEKKKVLLARMLYVSGDIYIIEGFFDEDTQRDYSSQQKNPDPSKPQLGNPAPDRTRSKEVLDDHKTKKKRNQANELKQMFWEKLMDGKNGLLGNKTVIIVEDMGGKLYNALNHKSIMEKVDKIVLFGTKTDKNKGSGIEEFNSFGQYTRFIKRLLGSNADQIFTIAEIKSNQNLKGSGKKRKKLKTILGSGSKNSKLKQKLGKMPSGGGGGGGFNLFGKTQISSLKKKKETDPFLSISPANSIRKKRKKLSKGGPGGGDTESESSSVTPLQQKEGYLVLKFLLPGILSVLKKKSKGKIKSEYDNDLIYTMTTKLTNIYLYLLGRCRIYRELLFFVITVAIFIGIDVYTGLWSTKQLESNYGIENSTAMILYLIISIIAAFAVFLRDISFTSTMMSNANLVHTQMMEKFSKVSLNWMETNYEAEVDFMLSYDMRRIDSRLNLQIENFIEALTLVLGGLLLLNYLYVGIVLVIHIVLMVYLYFTLKLFLKTTRNIVKFIAENTALLQDVLNQTMDQVFMYRVMNADSIMHKKFKTVTNEMQRAMTHLGFYCLRWLGVRLGWINITLIFTAYFLPIVMVVFLSDLNFELSKFELGLAISWSLKLVGFLTTAVNNYVKTQIDVVSYGRMHHFLKEVETEEDGFEPFDPQVEDLDRLPLMMEGIDMSYGDRKFLNDINMKVGRRDVVGILGKSGSGKHTLSNLIMRVYDSDDLVAHRRKKKREALEKEHEKKNGSKKSSKDEKKEEKPLTSSLKQNKSTSKKSGSRNGSTPKKVRFKEIGELDTGSGSGSPSGSEERDFKNSKFFLMGRNTKTTNHQDHKRYVSFLKSDPVLFSGRIRENIDPSFEFQDHEIMSVMKYLDGVEVLKENFIGKRELVLISEHRGDGALEHDSNPLNSNTVSEKLRRGPMKKKVSQRSLGGRSDDNNQLTSLDHNGTPVNLVGRPPRTKQEARSSSSRQNNPLGSSESLNSFGRGRRNNNTSSGVVVGDAGRLRSNELRGEGVDNYSVLSGTEKIRIQQSIPMELHEIDIKALQNSKRTGGGNRKELQLGHIFDGNAESGGERSDLSVPREPSMDLKFKPAKPVIVVQGQRQRRSLYNREYDLPAKTLNNNKYSPVKHSMTKGGNKPFRDHSSRLETIESQRTLLSKANESFTKQTVPTDWLPDNLNNALKQEVTAVEKKLFERFLMTMVNSHSAQDFPLPLLKLIKATKMVLEKPRIALIDRYALEYSPQRGIEELMCLLMTTKNLRNTSFFFVFSDVFESMFLFDKVVCLEKGSISQQGTTSKILKSWLNSANEELKEANERKDNVLKSKLEDKIFKIVNLQFLIEELKQISRNRYMASVAFDQESEAGGSLNRPAAGGVGRKGVGFEDDDADFDRLSPEDLAPAPAEAVSAVVDNHPVKSQRREPGSSRASNLNTIANPPKDEEKTEKTRQTL